MSEAGVKWYVFTDGPRGTSVTSTASEQLAIKLCAFAIGSGCWKAFYSK